MNTSSHRSMQVTSRVKRDPGQDVIPQNTERLLHMILANVEDLIAVIAPDGRRLYNSPSYSAIFGKREQMRGTDSFKDIHPDDRAMVRRVFQETVETGVGKRIVYRFMAQGRPVRFIESQGNVIRDADGNVTKVVIVSRDITNRKRIDDERLRLDVAIEQIAESIVITDQHGTIVYVNPACERQTGYTRDELIGLTPSVLKSGLHDVPLYQTLWATILRGETWTGELTNRRKNGTLYVEKTTISPVRDAFGNIINFVAVKRDVTHQREVEKQLLQSQKLASLGQLAEGIAHDVNNIMNVLGGIYELLEPRLQDPALGRYLGLAKDAIAKGSDIGRRLMEFSQTGSPDLKPLSLGSVIATLQSTLFRTIEKTIDVGVTMERDLPLIKGDEARVFQSLLTLCLNARDGIHAVPGGKGKGRIEIRADALEGWYVRNRFGEATADTYVRIRISDDGIGMDSEVRKHIFEPFFTTRERQSGSGLGLAMAHATMRAHDGFIDFESEPNQGATFSLYFPVVRFAREKDVAPAPGAIRGGSETILLVEDEEGLRIVLEQTLCSAGYTVLSATDGSQAFTVYAHHNEEIAAVISDMGLPRESGYDLFLKIRALDPSATVLFVSGYMDETLSSKLSTAGAAGFLAKPFAPAVLLARLREILDQRA